MSEGNTRPVAVAALQVSAARPESEAAEPAGGPRNGGESTLRRLRLFLAVAHSATLTRAAKLLNLSQPTLSQQLTAFEAALGVPLFHRRSNRMVLTEAGETLLVRAEKMLRLAQELEDSLPGLGRPARQTLRLAGVTSVMRAILPAALRRLSDSLPEIDLDIHEGAPAEILDLLYARRIHIGLMAANSVAEVAAGFAQVPVMEDPFVLAVPEGLDLSDVQDPLRDLDPTALALLQSTIQFVFGTQHSNRIQAWYDLAIPGNRLATRVRSFEMALDLVAAGLGVSVLPSLTARLGGGPRRGVRLYGVPLGARRIVAMLPQQDPLPQAQRALLTALQAAGHAATLPRVAAIPPFIAQATPTGGP